MAPRDLAQATILARCSTGSTRPVGFDGELIQISETRSGPIAVSESALIAVAPAMIAPTS